MNSPRSLKIGASRHKAGSFPCSVHSSLDTQPPERASVSAGSNSGVSETSGVCASGGVSAGVSTVPASAVLASSSDMACPLLIVVLLLVVLLKHPTHPHRLQ